MCTRFRSIGFLLCCLVAAGRAGEGMYPVNQIQQLDLRSRGIHISPLEIFNPGGIGLVKAIVQLTGCTGSFVSPGGLILTNHHCSFGAVQAASSPEHDYITNGFLARSPAEEMPARGLTARITESYRDVSADILAVLSDTMSPVTRTQTIERSIRAIVAAAEEQHPGKRAEVAEMFPGRSYTLFMYSTIRDVRLVYVPPRAIGEFGGETDNWVWPRHTGDFSFVRAYVAPDGTPAEYSPANVPYQPEIHARIASNGAREGDTVFSLGYPGRTYRHRTSHYLAYEYEIRMPYIAELYAWQIATMEALGKRDRAVGIRLAARIKSLANTEKNYRGKLIGIRRLSLIERKREEERALQQFIAEDPARASVGNDVMRSIGEVYDEMRRHAAHELTLDYLRQSPPVMGIALTLAEAAQEMNKPDPERKSAYMERNIGRTTETLARALENYDRSYDRIVLRDMLLRAAQLPSEQRIDAVDRIVDGRDAAERIDRFLDEAYEESHLTEGNRAAGLFGKSVGELNDLDDPFISLALELLPLYDELTAVRRQREGRLTKLYATLIGLKEQFLKTSFIPDANGTLRWTWGTITGYSPADALHASPITTLSGLIDKATGVEPFETPAKVRELHRLRVHGRYHSEEVDDVPVALLYNLDTTGGNSGSPLLDSHGNLIGLNFDRAFEATINDYTWSAEYSRSIGVDIRFILWVTELVGGAGHLLDEMGIPRSQ